MGSTVWNELVWRMLQSFTLFLAVLFLALVAGELYIVISYAVGNGNNSFSPTFVEVFTYLRCASSRTGFILFVSLFAVNALSVLLVVAAQWSEFGPFAVPAIFLQPLFLACHLYHYTGMLQVQQLQQGGSYSSLNQTTVERYSAVGDLSIIDPQHPNSGMLAMMNLGSLCFPLVFTFIALLTSRSISILKTLQRQEDRMESTVRSIMGQNFANQNRHIANQLYPEREPKVLQPIVIAQSTQPQPIAASVENVVPPPQAASSNHVTAQNGVALQVPLLASDAAELTATIKKALPQTARPVRFKRKQLTTENNNSLIAETAGAAVSNSNSVPMVTFKIASAEENASAPKDNNSKRSSLRKGTSVASGSGSGKTASLFDSQVPGQINDEGEDISNNTQNKNLRTLDDAETDSVWSTYEDYKTSQDRRAVLAKKVADANNQRSSDLPPKYEANQSALAKASSAGETAQRTKHKHTEQ